MKKYNDEEISIINEKRNFLLSLRKKKLNKKILEKRNNFININNENQNQNSNKCVDVKKSNSFISNIKSKFNELLSDKNNNETNYIKTLNEIIKYLQNSFKDIQLNEISMPLIEYKIINKIYNDLTINKYINNYEILNLLLIIFSCILFIYNYCLDSDILKKDFILDKKYVIFYLSLFDIENDEVIYNSYKFIGLLSHDSVEIKKIMLDEKILEKIINHNKYDNEKEIIEVKIWCISQFDINIKYNENSELCLRLQDFYIFVFNNYINNNNYNNELLNNYIKILTNLSFCIGEEYINNLLKTNILNYLLESNINNKLSKEHILTIIGNMNYISNPKIYFYLYNITIQYLISIILDKKNSEDIIGLSYWCINNYCIYKNLCLDIYFEKNLLSINKNYIIKNEKINENIFNEICIGYVNLIRSINEDKKYILIKKYNIISLIIQGFKKIELFQNINKIGVNVIEIIFALLTIDNEELINYNRYIFESEGGNEYIFEKINNILLEQNNIKNTELDENEINILEFINYIKSKLLDFDYD